ICHGCIVEGTVERSILSPGVRVAPGAVVRDSIVMTDTVVGPDATVDRSILDKQIVVGPGALVGDGTDLTPNHQEPSRLYTGITVVGKRARIPPRARLGRNVKVVPGAREEDFLSLEVPSGATVERRSGQTSW
ncbi:MAG TPA: glucose-1-phosphate adenylyltransferase, partial [Chloroflexota bacterium]